MAAFGSLQQIFEKPLPENPTLLESLSPWKQIKSVKPKVDDSSYTEIFGELHFKENYVQNSSAPPFPQTPSSPVSSSSFFAEIHPQNGIERIDKEKNDSPKKFERSKSLTESYFPISYRKQYYHSDSFSSMNSESLSLCTEGLGFESSDDVEELGNDQVNFDFQQHQEDKISTSRLAQSENPWKEFKRSRTSKGPSFPPPISCIGRTGKPWVCFKSYRQDGRFILQEIRIPTQEFLHACREDGRLRLQFIQSDDEILEGDEEEEEEQEIDDYGEDIQEVHDEDKVADAAADDDHDRDKNEDGDEDDADTTSFQINNNHVEGSSIRWRN